MGGDGGLFVPAACWVYGCLRAEGMSTPRIQGHKHDSHTVGVIEKNCLTLTGHIDAGLPDAIAPSISGGDIGSLMSGAILVALIGYLESIAIAKVRQLRDYSDVYFPF